MGEMMKKQDFLTIQLYYFLCLKPDLPLFFINGEQYRGGDLPDSLLISIPYN